MDNGQLTTEEIEANLAYFRYGREGCFVSYVEGGLLPPGWLARSIAEALKTFNEAPSTE